MTAWFRQNIPLIAALLVAAIIVGGALSMRVAKKDADGMALTLVAPENREAMRGDFAKDVDKDTDGDGLKDWEEVLYGTSIVNADSDGDGTNDDDEVRAGRDPLKPGPDDTTTTTGESFAQYRAPKDISKTEGLARELFATYASLKTGGGIGTEFQNQAVEAVVERYVQESVVYTYSSDELTYASTQDSETIAEYRTAVREALQAAAVVERSELEVYAYLIDSGRSVYEEELSRNASIYRGIAQALKRIPVPLLLSANHLALMNALMDFAAAIDDMVATYRDPLAALIATSAYADADDRARGALRDFYELTAP
jgi:hypothetical protein